MKSYKFDVDLVAARSTKAITINLVDLAGVGFGCCIGKQGEGEQLFEVRIRRTLNLPGDFLTQLLCHAILVDASSVSRKCSFFPSAAFRFEPMHISIVDCYLVVGIIPRSRSCQATARPTGITD
uniref:Candidate secreted effector n=1 Tax=Meloidogyne incognita TaxID=6306 RepID=A0A914MGU0_MELIC